MTDQQHYFHLDEHCDENGKPIEGMKLFTVGFVEGKKATAYCFVLGPEEVKRLVGAVILHAGKDKLEPIIIDGKDDDTI